MDWDPIIAIVSIIFGILVIAVEGLLRWLVGIFFILLGIWYIIQWSQKRGATRPAASPPASPPQTPPPSTPPEQPRPPNP